MGCVLRSARVALGGLRGVLQNLQNVQNNAESSFTAQTTCRIHAERPPQVELIVITDARIQQTWNVFIYFKK